MRCQEKPRNLAILESILDRFKIESFRLFEPLRLVYGKPVLTIETGNPPSVFRILWPASKVGPEKYLDNLEQFKLEIAALNELREHPHVVKILSSSLGCDNSDGMPHLELECLTGGDLSVRLAQVRASLSDKLYLFEKLLPLLDLLSEMNKRGIVHGDIKCANICFDEHDTAKLIDFGAVDRVRHDSKRPSKKLFTILYVAPERAAASIQGGYLNDMNTDLYSLGIVFFKVLSGGRLPFEGALDPDNFLRSRQTPNMNLLLDQHNNALEPFVPVLSKMLQFNPSERYRSPQDAKIELEIALETCLMNLGKVDVSKRGGDNPKFSSCGSENGASTQNHFPPLNFLCSP